MPGGDARRSGRFRVSEKLERQPALRILRLAFKGAAQPQQAVHEAPLGHFELVPGLLVAGLAEIRNDAREAA
jgi:hypothetical protein